MKHSMMNPNIPLRMLRCGFAAALAMVLAICLGTSALAYGGQAVEAHAVTQPIVIDGDLGQWDLSSPVTANVIEQVVRDVGQWSGPEDTAFDVYVMWDADNLYLAAKVLDDTPYMYREGFPPDMADSLVIFFSTDPEADPERDAYLASDFRLTQVIDDYYFVNGIDREMIDDPLGFETVGDDGCDVVLDDFECALVEIEGGYIYESIIPLSNFTNDQIPLLVPAVGVMIGFEIAMFDLDFPCPGVATVRMEACGSEDADTNPSLWGTLTFVE